MSLQNTKKLKVLSKLDKTKTSISDEYNFVGANRTLDIS